MITNENEGARKVFEIFLTLAGLKKYELADWLGFTDAALSQKIRNLSPEKTHELICESLSCTMKKYGLLLDEDGLKAWQNTLQQFANNLLKQAGLAPMEDEEEE